MVHFGGCSFCCAVEPYCIIQKEIPSLFIPFISIWDPSVPRDYMRICAPVMKIWLQLNKNIRTIRRRTYYISINDKKWWFMNTIKSSF